MNSFARWVARNRTLAKVLFGTLLCVCYSSLVLLDVPLWIVVPIDLFVVLFVCLWVDASIIKLLQDPLKALDEGCDPYPLLQETAVQMGYGYRGVTDQANRINHALALRCAGQYQQAWEVLTAINIDRYSGTLPATKYVYYNNLEDVLTLMGRYPEAEIWYQKAVQIYQDMPENRMKRQLREAVEGAAASAWFRRGEYAKARECLNALHPQQLRSRVHHALLYAQCCIAEGNPEGARQPLEFVINWGNRLAAVQVAQELMNQLTLFDINR